MTPNLPLFLSAAHLRAALTDKRLKLLWQFLNKVVGIGVLCRLYRRLIARLWISQFDVLHD